MLPDFDELNNIESTIQDIIYGGGVDIETGRVDQKRKKELEDTIFELLTMSYVYGLHKAGLDLKEDIPTDRYRMKEVVSAKTAGKDYLERLDEYLESADSNHSFNVLDNVKTSDELVHEISVLAETEAGRVMNTASMDAIDIYRKKHPKADVYKTWITMEDDRVRDPHWELHGSTVPYDAYFYSGEHKALAPHGFGVPELDVNCRCVLELSAR